MPLTDYVIKRYYKTVEFEITKKLNFLGIDVNDKNYIQAHFKCIVRKDKNDREEYYHDDELILSICINDFVLSKETDKYGM